MPIGPFGGTSARLGVHDLKPVLHRYLIDALEEKGENLLEGTRTSLAIFVAEQVSEYVSRRQIAISRYEVDRLAEELVDELTGFGPLEILLKDDAVSEILVNGPHRVFVERGGVLQLSDLRFIDDQHVLRVIQRILAPVGRRLDESSPMVDARMPDGSRINAIIPPVALDGPCISVRKFRKDMLRSADLLASNSLDQAILSCLELMVRRRCNIMVSGGTGTGKTTLLNMLSQMIDPRERIVTIEDTAELELLHDHVVRLETRPPNAEGFGQVAARELVRNALRMRPDRIVLGEIRGAEVLDVLTAMNTGHDGSMSTVHANNAQDALLRLETPGWLLRRQDGRAHLAADHLRGARRGHPADPPARWPPLHQRGGGGARPARGSVRHQHPVPARPFGQRHLLPRRAEPGRAKDAPRLRPGRQGAP